VWSAVLVAIRSSSVALQEIPQDSSVALEEIPQE
jgi:hypothetical protein